MPGFYVIAVGYDQDSKCQLLNAMSQDEKHQVFTVMKCKTKLCINKVKGYTISGHSITLVQTPSLNTPAWTEQEKKLKGDKWKNCKCAFVYVKAAQTTADDVACVNKLADTFGKDRVKCVSCYDAKKAGGVLCVTDTSVFKGGDCLHTFGINGTLQTKSNEAWDILNELKDSADFSNTPRPSDSESEVGAVGIKNNIQQNIGGQALDMSKGDDLIATVKIPESGKEDQTPVYIVETLTKKDWDLFILTLKQGKARSRHVRVNAVGNHGVGKTTLIYRLQGKNIPCPNPDPTPTENLDIHRVTTICEEKDGKREWKTGNHDTFLEDLNIERMADAMINTERMGRSSLDMSFASLSSMDDSQVLSPDDADNSFTTNLLTPSQLDNSFDKPQNRFSFTKEHSNPLESVSVQLGSEEFEDEPYVSNSPKLIQPPPIARTNSEFAVIRNKEMYLKQVLGAKRAIERRRIERMYFSFWDYAGQATYYATHQLFMSPSAVYLLLFDLSKELNDMVEDNMEFRMGVLKTCTVGDALKFWTHSIKAYTKDEYGGNAPFIIVGTHKEELSSVEIKRKFKEVRVLLDTNAECIAIDNTMELEKDESLALLKTKIVDNGLGVLHENVSSQWINLEYDMHTYHRERGYMTFSELQKLDKGLDVPMCDADRLEYFLAHQHARGHLLFYKHLKLKSLIITDPSLLVNFLNLLMRRQKTERQMAIGFNENGIVTYDFIKDSAKKIDIEEHACLDFLEILVNLNIMHNLSSTDTDQYFIPCLLPDKQMETDNDDCDRSSLFQIQFKPIHIHQAMYHQIICALLKNMYLIEDRGEKQIHSLHACFKVKDNDLVWLEIFWKASVIYFKLKDFDQDENNPLKDYVDYVIENLEQAIEDVLLANHHGNVSYSFYVKCPVHIENFVELKVLKENGATLCHYIEEAEDGHNRETRRHKVKIDEVYGVSASSKYKDSSDNPNMLEKPTDQMIGRLAWKLYGKERADTLMLRLDFQDGFHKADMICRDFNDPGSELVYLLNKWRNEHGPEGTCQKLLNLLTKLKHYDINDLKNVMFTQRLTDPRIANIPPHSSDKNRDIYIVSRNIGRGYVFVLLECGVEWHHIQQERENNKHDTEEMIRKLLIKWRQMYPENSTTERLLEAVAVYGDRLGPIIDELQNLQPLAGY